MKPENLDRLLDANENPAFSLINPQGEAPLLITCDHAGNAVPNALRGLDIAPDILDLHIAYDIGARQVAMLLSAQLNAPFLYSHYSRLVLDLNRQLEDAESIPAVSDGHRIVGNENLTDIERRRRGDALFHPYHQCHGELLEQLKLVYQHPKLLCIHSFTPCLESGEARQSRPWHIGVLWAKDEVLAKQLIAGLSQQVGMNGEPLHIGNNAPYDARVVPGYSMLEQGAKQGVEVAFLEIRQDLIADEQGQQWAAKVVYDALLPLLDNTPY